MGLCLGTAVPSLCLGTSVPNPPETVPSSMKSHQSKPLTPLQAHVRPDAETLSNLISHTIRDHLSLPKRVRYWKVENSFKL